jgi:hypothetical protein
MELIKLKLSKITTFWNSYVWNLRIIQSRILWNKEVETNYYGDILDYFSDTFDYIKNKDSYSSSMIHTIGFLQIIYVQQDLVDEILRIFRLDKSSSASKQPNRLIRNELVGHPISRFRNGELKSSTIWGRNSTGSNLNYIKYSKENNFSLIEENFEIDGILERHEKFLNNQFDMIIEKINSIFNFYSKQLDNLERIYLDDSKFEATIVLTEQIMEYLFESKYLFDPKILRQLKEKENEHPRYKLGIEKFKQELKNNICWARQSIEEFKKDVRIEPKFDEELYSKKNKISFGNGIENNYQRTYIYEIEKLAEKKMFVISSLKSEFKSNVDIINEIKRLEMYINDNAEYYSSLEFLKQLLRTQSNA